ncbi:MAG: DegT/DnrJ/EryC1/StrS family aminotransferase [Dethiobacteria bacterium]
MIRLTIPDFDEQEYAEVKEVLASGFLVQGPKVAEFERVIADYIGARHAIAVSSGTAALHLALVALDIKAGDEVIVPDFTFPATANVVELVGATTRFVDIKTDDFCIDVGRIEAEINENTRAIIPVHEFGHPADMDVIVNLAQKYNLKIIEDAACALGAEYKGRKAGTIGAAGCFSFHPRKSITMGEGGIIATGDDRLASRLKILRNHGLDQAGGEASFTAAGFNYRLTEFQAALGIVQAGKMEQINAQRRKIVDYYNKGLKDTCGINLPVEKEDCRHAWQTYHLLLDESISRDGLIGRLREDGIESNFGAHAVHAQPYYRRKYDLDDSKFGRAIKAYNQGLALPLHPRLVRRDLDKVIRCIRGHLNERA